MAEETQVEIVPEFGDVREEEVLDWDKLANFLRGKIPGADTPENNHMAEQAIEQYQKVLDDKPAREQKVNSAKGIAYLYLNMKKFDADFAAPEIDERARTQGGTLRITSRVGHGTRVLLTLPLDRPSTGPGRAEALDARDSGSGIRNPVHESRSPSPAVVWDKQ